MLSEREQSLLEFERGFEGRDGAKEAAVRARLGLSPARYYQLLFALIDDPAALQHDALLVRRLQRLRDDRLRQRRVRRPGTGSPTHDQDG